jgi:hypothetical protein
LILRPEQTRISLAYSTRTRRSPFSPRTLWSSRCVPALIPCTGLRVADLGTSQKCFGAAPKRSLFALSQLDRQSLVRRAGLSCPAANVKSPELVVDQTIKAAA